MKLSDLVIFNPKRPLKKGESAAFVEMAALPENGRDINRVDEKIFTGGGSKFANKDTLFARITPCLENGKTSLVSGLSDGEVAFGSTEFIVLAAKEPEYDSDYIYYLSRLGEFRSFARSRMEGTSGRQRVAWQSLADYEYDFPDKRLRKFAGDVLKKFDDKILLNHQINQTFEQMAQALFKSWFVDFEPVKAKMAVLEAGGSQADVTLAAMTAISGKDADALAFFERKHPEHYAELKATAELFPSVMQGHELGEIPEGWQLNRLSNLAILHYGKALKKTERIEGPYPVYGSGGITGSHNNYLVEGPSIIVGRKGSIGTLYWEDGKFHPIDTVYFVEGKDEIPLTYLYYLMKTLNLSGMNTDAAVPGLNRDNVYRLEVLQPDKFILSLFDKHMSAIRNNIQKNDFSTVILSDLRDTLLPKLLSGEITLPEAEQIISEEA
ncbi:restriction endonuclease subunit S [Salmonella enterica subsp. enterica serovar Rissen]|uniref:Restriction endonuclease subunit S n=1 Tax=Salmonella enterica TaxID=28901 RepID=A0A5T2TUV8_SALER|nr:restriction endonuclease subunit S [Salmonella enterica]ECJ1657931.1 restriction endonuclease subunit S [Salmonella enterica subsp. enterica serovar Rissen]EDA5803048.1 restriction endonuclease subunit S [Salmonella enterica subsp. enterica serovar Rissen]EDB1985217.1 restriction endonuclease subunit S [Salmonella enterica subsp. enterica serovar Rissen]EDE0798376.1 restriction endonuclease subunit S [Salmonella enterica subsp. enterica serovar Rissen]